MAKRAGFEDRSDDDFQENFGDLSTTTPTLEDSEEDKAIGADLEEQDNTASTINGDKSCGTICTDDHPLKVVTSDQGTEFNNQLNDELMRLLNIDHK